MSGCLIFQALMGILKWKPICFALFRLFYMPPYNCHSWSFIIGLLICGLFCTSSFPTNQENWPNVSPYIALYWVNVLAIVPTLGQSSCLVGLIYIIYCIVNATYWSYEFVSRKYFIFYSTKNWIFERLCVSINYIIKIKLRVACCYKLHWKQRHKAQQNGIKHRSADSDTKRSKVALS